MDVKIIKDENDKFTIGITNGDLTPENAFDTPINMSLFIDARAPADLVVSPEKRRGWLGNTVSLVEGRQLGSLLWLVDQSRLIPDTLNKNINFAQLSLNWFVEDGIAKSVKVGGTIIPRKGVQLDIEITSLSGVTTNHYVNLWELTGNVT